MSDYALTWPQLARQVKSADLGEDALLRLRDHYDVAEWLFDGFYRPQGAPFLCHLVRTASIVLAHEQPPDVVSAALLHSVYQLHRFRDSVREGPRRSHRLEMVGQVGAEVEALLWAFHVHSPGYYAPGGPERHLRQLPEHPPALRHVLVIRLANDLEDCLDLGFAYRNGGQHIPDRIRESGDAMVELAGQLGVAALGAELAAAFAELSAAYPVTGAYRRGQIYERPTVRPWSLGPTGRLGRRAQRSARARWRTWWRRRRGRGRARTGPGGGRGRP